MRTRVSTPDFTILGLDETALVQFHRQDLFHDVDDLRATLSDLVKDHFRHVWVDFWGVTGMSNWVFAWLARLYVRPKKGWRQIVLIGLGTMVEELIRLVKFDTLLTVHPVLFPTDAEDEPAEQKAFVQALRSNPMDLGARMAFTDWLEEQGDDRARLMRLHCFFALEEAEEKGSFVPGENDLFVRAPCP